MHKYIISFKFQMNNAYMHVIILSRISYSYQIGYQKLLENDVSLVMWYSKIFLLVILV